MKWLSNLIDNASNFFAHRRGLLPLIGIGLVILNFFMPLLMTNWISESDLFLHLGVIIAIFGMMLARAL